MVLGRTHRLCLHSRPTPPPASGSSPCSRGCTTTISGAPSATPSRRRSCSPITSAPSAENARGAARAAVRLVQRSRPGRRVRRDALRMPEERRGQQAFGAAEPPGETCAGRRAWERERAGCAGGSGMRRCRVCREKCAKFLRNFDRKQTLLA